MISITTQNRLLNLFQQIARGQKDVQTKRQYLAEMHNFSPYQAFKRLDRYDKDHLTSRDFLLFLSDNYINASELESYDLMKSFDKNGTARVSYIDFRNGILPSYSQVLRDVAGSRPSYRIPPYHPLPYTVERGLANLLNSELNYQRDVAQLRQILRMSYDFTVNGAFRSIASSEKYIYAADIRDLFRRCRVQLLASEQQAIMRRLDQDADGRLSYYQFYDAVNPTRPQLKAPQTSYAYQRSSPSPVRRLSAKSYSPSPQRRSYGYSVSPARRPLRTPYYDSPIRASYQRARVYYSPPSRPLRDQVYYSPSRRSFLSNTPYQRPSYRPLRPQYNNRSLNQRNTQPNEYSPLRGFTATRDHPNNSFSYRPLNYQPKQYYPQRKQQQFGGKNITHEAERAGQNRVSQAQENSSQQDHAKDEPIENEDEELPPNQIDEAQKMKMQKQGQDQSEHQQAQEQQGGQMQEDQEKEFEAKEPDVLQDPVEIPKQPENQAEQKIQPSESDSMQRPAYQDTPPEALNQGQSAYFNTPPQQQRGKQLGNSSNPMASSQYSRYSPEKQRITGTLARNLRNQMAEDTRVEYLKQELAIKADFNLHDSFDFFDIGKRGKISSYDLKEGLMDLKVYCSREDATMLIQKFDEDKDGMLSKAEFSRLFTPNDPISAQQLIDRQPFNSDGFYSRKNRTEGLIQDVIRAMIDCEKSVENVRVRLRLEGSSVRDAFEVLDKSGKGHISKYDMSVIMNENYVSATNNELMSFMDRFDKDKDGKFVDEMIPKSPSRLY